MNVLDVNVLVASFHADHPHHVRMAGWWDTEAAAGAFAVPDLAWVGFVRVVTNARVFDVPAPLGRAWDFVEALRADGRWTPCPADDLVGAAFARIATAADARGDLVPDAYIAAVATSLGASVVTFDRDFRRFDGVRIVEPA